MPKVPGSTGMTIAPEIGPRVSYRPLQEERARPGDLGLLEAEARLRGAQQISRASSNLGRSIASAGAGIQRVWDVRDINEAESFALDAQADFVQWDSQNVNPQDPSGGDRGVAEIEKRSQAGWTISGRSYSDLSRVGQRAFDQMMGPWMRQQTTRYATNEAAAIREQSNVVLQKLVSGSIRTLVETPPTMLQSGEEGETPYDHFVQSTYKNYVDHLNKTGYEIDGESDPDDISKMNLPASVKENIASTLSSGFLTYAKSYEKSDPAFVVGFLEEHKDTIDPSAYATAMQSAQTELAQAQKYAKVDEVIAMYPNSESDALKAVNRLKAGKLRDEIGDLVQAHFKDQEAAKVADESREKRGQMEQFSQLVSAEARSREPAWRVNASKFIDDVENIQLRQELQTIFAKVEETADRNAQLNAGHWMRGMTDQDMRKMMTMRDDPEQWGNEDTPEEDKPRERILLENLSPEDYSALAQRMGQLEDGIETPVDAVTEAVRYAFPSMQTNRSKKLTPETSEYQYAVGMIADEIKRLVDDGTISEREIHAEAKRRGAMFMRNYKDVDGNIIDYQLAGTETDVFGFFTLGGDEASSIRFLQMRDDAEARGLPIPRARITGELNMRLEKIYESHREAKSFEDVPWAQVHPDKKQAFLVLVLSGKTDLLSPSAGPAQGGRY